MINNSLIQKGGVVINEEYIDGKFEKVQNALKIYKGKLEAKIREENKAQLDQLRIQLANVREEKNLLNPELSSEIQTKDLEISYLKQQINIKEQENNKQILDHQQQIRDQLQQHEGIKRNLESEYALKLRELENNLNLNIEEKQKTNRELNEKIEEQKLKFISDLEISSQQLSDYKYYHEEEIKKKQIELRNLQGEILEIKFKENISLREKDLEISRNKGLIEDLKKQINNLNQSNEMNNSLINEIQQKLEVILSP